MRPFDGPHFSSARCTQADNCNDLLCGALSACSRCGRQKQGKVLRKSIIEWANVEQQPVPHDTKGDVDPVLDSVQVRYLSSAVGTCKDASECLATRLDEVPKKRFGEVLVALGLCHHSLKNSRQSGASVLSSEGI